MPKPGRMTCGMTCHFDSFVIKWLPGTWNYLPHARSLIWSCQGGRRRSLLMDCLSAGIRLLRRKLYSKRKRNTSLASNSLNPNCPMVCDGRKTWFIMCSPIPRMTYELFRFMKNKSYIWSMMVGSSFGSLRGWNAPGVGR